MSRNTISWLSGQESLPSLCVGFLAGCSLRISPACVNDVTGGVSAHAIESPYEAHDVPDKRTAVGASNEEHAAADEALGASGDKDGRAEEGAAEHCVEEAPGEPGNEATVDIEEVGS
jgi:hypothetical protein